MYIYNLHKNTSAQEYASSQRRGWGEIYDEK